MPEQQQQPNVPPSLDLCAALMMPIDGYIRQYKGELGGLVKNGKFEDSLFQTGYIEGAW